MPTTICACQWFRRKRSLCTRQKPVAGALEELEAFARKENIPIIPHDGSSLDSCKPYNQRKSTKLGQQLIFQRSMAENAPMHKLRPLIGMRDDWLCQVKIWLNTIRESKSPCLKEMRRCLTGFNRDL